MSLLIDALKKGHNKNSAGSSDDPMRPPNEKSNTSRSILWLLIIILVVISICLSVYLHRLTPKPTVNAKTRPRHQLVHDQTAAHNAVIKSDDGTHKISISNNRDTTLMDRYQQALNDIKAHQYPEATVLLNNNKLIQETQGQSAIALAKVYLKMGNVNRAEEVVRNALTYNTLAQDDLDGLLGQILFEQKRYEEAIHILKQHSPSITEHPGYYGLLARAYLKVNNPKPAINLFQQLVTSESNEVAWWLGLALALQEDGQYEQSVLAYQRAAKMQNNDPQVQLFIQKELDLMPQVNQGKNNEQPISK